MTTRDPGVRARLREYFLSHAGQIIESRDLEAVAGRSDIARWIKELRYEDGLTILTHRERTSLQPGQYVCGWWPEDREP